MTTVPQRAEPAAVGTYAPIAIVVFNFVPLYFVLVGAWGVFEALLLYWWESFLVTLLNVVRMFFQQDQRRSQQTAESAFFREHTSITAPGFRTTNSPWFFLAVCVFWMLGCLVLTYEFLLDVPALGVQSDDPATIARNIFDPALFLPVLILLAGELTDIVNERIGHKRALQSADLMGFVMLRMWVYPLLVLFGLAFADRWTWSPIALIVGVKTFAELVLYAYRRRLQTRVRGV